jgi:S1-C subfamily serine protease
MRQDSTLIKTFVFVAGSIAALLARAPAHAETVIHLIVVADTLDPKIGKSVEVDMQMIEGAFRRQVLGDARLKIDAVGREACRPDQILQRIAAVKLQPEDALVFFFSGHGAHDDQQEQYFKFPRLGPDMILTRKQVRAAIKARGCRLGVLLTDCCNNMSIIPKRPLFPTAQMPMSARGSVFSALFQSLFVDTTGFVDLTSSKKGERSLAYPAKTYVGHEGVYAEGGLFSTAFERVLSSYMGEPLDWSSVFDKTAEIVRLEFRRLKPDGLDNEDEPENPQMTQTVVHHDLGIREAGFTRPIVDQDRTKMPLINPGALLLGPGFSMGVLGYENAGKGLVVWSTAPASPAARLGLEYGDQILKINDTSVRTARGYSQLLKDSEGMVELVFRDVRTGQVKSATIALDEPRNNERPPAGKPVLGASGEVADGQGIRLTAIVPGSRAALLGLDPGDVILDINGTPVRTMEEYHEAVRNSPDEMWITVLNVRTGKPLGSVVALDRAGPGRANFTFGIHATEGQGGLYIWATHPGGPADRLRLEQGDMIVAIDGIATNTVDAYRSAIKASTGVVDVTFRDVRTGQVRADKVTLDRGALARTRPGLRPSLGVHAEDLPGKGMKVVAIVPQSPAALLQLDPGDIVTHINGQFVDNDADFRRAIESSDDEMVFTLIDVRTGKSQGEVVQLDR